MAIDIPIQINMLQFGRVFVNGRRRHVKVAPCTIVAEVLDGAYEIARGPESIRVTTGGLFVAHEGDDLDILHVGTPDMRARYLHVRFTVHEVLRLDQCYRFPFYVSPNQARPIHDVLDHFDNSERADSLFASAKDMASAHDLLLELMLLGRERQEWPNTQQRLRRFLPLFQWIKQNLHRPIAVEDLARIACLSPSHFHSLFRSTVDCPPMAYVKRIRLSEAQRLLLTSEKSMAEIAALTGFSNAFHFSREFKKAYQMAPLRYRQQGWAF